MEAMVAITHYSYRLRLVQVFTEVWVFSIFFYTILYKEADLRAYEGASELLLPEFRPNLAFLGTLEV